MLFHAKKEGFCGFFMFPYQRFSKKHYLCTRNYIYCTREMALKHFFSGKSGAKFWVNIALMVLLVVAIPVTTLYLLDTFTHHGEKIEVPSVTGKSLYEAENMLKERGLTAMVIDSTYVKYAKPGSVLEQSPKPGYEVKGGRVIYLVMNLKGEPKAELPDVVGHGSLREAVALLQSLGFRLTAHESVIGRPKDLLIGVKQGGRYVQAGQVISRERPLTLVVGAGEIFDEDSLDVDEYDDTDVNLDAGGESNDDGADFDIEL